MQPSGTGLTTTATQNAIEQQLPVLFAVNGPYGGRSHCPGRTVMPPVFAGSFCAQLFRKRWRSMKEEEVPIARGWHGQPNDIAGRSKVRFWAYLTFELNIHYTLLQPRFSAIPIAPAPLTNFFPESCISSSRTSETMHIQDSESSLHWEEVPAIYLSIVWIY